MLTKNEKQVLRFLAAELRKDFSINEIARLCRLSPNGAYKLLKKLEKEGILKAKDVANIRAYKLDFENEKTEQILGLAFIPDRLEGRIKIRAQDFKPLEKIVDICILFGSYVSEKKKPRDLDVLFVFKQKDFKDYKKALASVQDIVPAKIQDIVQTGNDLLQNLKKGDPVIKNIFKKGVVLWGFGRLTEVVRNASG